MVVNYWFGHAATSPVTFNFTISNPISKFSFDSSSVGRQLAFRSLKRRRPLWDVDGGSEGKKKRRLRLDLITSRLSQPFSSPATNIISRGSSRITFWAKNRRPDKSVLCRAAVMNRLRNSLSAAKGAASKAHETARQGIPLSELRVQGPRPAIALPPSPLGLSNYDALDLEDELLNGEDDGDGEKVVYCDFSIMKPYTPAENDSYDYLDELDGIPVEVMEDRPPPAHVEHLTEILLEKERQLELDMAKI